MYNAEACDKFAGPIFASLRLGDASFEKMLQRWPAAGNPVYNLTGPRFELQFPLGQLVAFWNPNINNKAINVEM